MSENESERKPGKGHPKGHIQIDREHYEVEDEVTDLGHRQTKKGN
ncbi:MAG TPA: hypothetical protein VJA46_13035 [Acidimicrobiia bacterium]|nr:hypothetical protein [Acidimicrobiia bacterium]